MIKAFVEQWEANKDAVRQRVAARTEEHKHGGAFDGTYADLVRIVVEECGQLENSWESMDPDRIVEIDHGDYQGCLVYVIASKGYQPSEYWYVKVWYGSCTVCDTLMATQTVDDVMTLCLHIVQKIKKMD